MITENGVSDSLRLRRLRRANTEPCGIRWHALTNLGRLTVSTDAVPEGKASLINSNRRQPLMAKLDMSSHTHQVTRSWSVASLWLSSFCSKATSKLQVPNTIVLYVCSSRVTPVTV